MPSRPKVKTGDVVRVEWSDAQGPSEAGWIPLSSWDRGLVAVVDFGILIDVTDESIVLVPHATHYDEDVDNWRVMSPIAIPLPNITRMVKLVEA